MKVYEYGKRENPTILLLPGTCCHHEMNFGKVIPLLVDSFHVLSVSYDGFDETEDTVFPDMISETEKIEKYVISHCGGSVRAAYGCSLGGSFVGLLVQREKIHIAHAILGSSDLDQDNPLPAKLKSKLVAGMVEQMIQTGKLPGFMQKRLDKKSSEEMGYYKKLLDSFGIGNPKMKFIKKQSIYNQFYSDLVTPLKDNISIPGTTVHVFYALKMGEQYEARYLKHFTHPDIIRINLQHEELLFCHPDEWAVLVKKICEGNK